MSGRRRCWKSQGIANESYPPATAEPALYGCDQTSRPSAHAAPGASGAGPGTSYLNPHLPGVFPAPRAPPVRGGDTKPGRRQVFVMSAACSAQPRTGPCGCRPSPGDVIQVRDGQDPHEQAHHQQPEHRADHGLTPGPGRAHSVFNPASCGPLLPAGTWSTAHCSSRPKAPAVTKNGSNQAMARSQSQRPGPGTHLCSRAMARANPTCRLGGRHRRDAARARVNDVATSSLGRQLDAVSWAGRSLARGCGPSWLSSVERWLGENLADMRLPTRPNVVVSVLDIVALVGDGHGDCAPAPRGCLDRDRPLGSAPMLVEWPLRGPRCTSRCCALTS